MRIKKEDVERLTGAMEALIMKLHEVDGRCVELTKDIDKQDLHLISFIGDKNSVIMRDIAEFLDIPFSTATGIVDKLVSKKYLVRVHSEEDRRTVLVKLDKCGLHACNIFTEMKEELGQRMLELVTPEEKEQFISIMEKITFKLTQQQLIEKGIN